jgi:integrase
LLFPDANGLPLRYSNWRNRVWLPALEKAGHPLAKSHGLRRATATTLNALGVDPKVAQEVLGHSDIRLTLDLYAESIPEAHKRAAKATAQHFLTKPRSDRAKNVPKAQSGITGSKARKGR